MSADRRLPTTLIIVSTEPDPEDECVNVAIETGEVFINNDERQRHGSEAVLTVRILRTRQTS